jgi:hypothetical protein
MTFIDRINIAKTAYRECRSVATGSRLAASRIAIGTTPTENRRVRVTAGGLPTSVDHLAPTMKLITLFK